MRDDEDVNVSRAGDHRLAGARPQEPSPRRAPAGPDDDLGRVERASEIQHGRGRVVARHRVEGAAKFLGERAQVGDFGDRRPGEPIGARDIHGVQVTAGAARGGASAAAQKPGTLGPPGDGNNDPLPGGPASRDAVVVPVAFDGFIDPVGEPKQGELTQGAEVADPEVLRQGGVDLRRLVDVAVGHPAPQRLGRHVDELDLVGGAHDLVGHRLLLGDAGDRGNDIVEGFQVLNVDCRDDVDSGGEQVLKVLPALLVASARGVGVGEFVDEGDLGAPGDDGIDVHLLESRSPMLQPAARHDLEALEHELGVRPTVGFAQGDDDIGPSGRPSGTLGEHGDGLADTWCCAEIDPQPSTGHGVILTDRSAGRDRR